MKKSLRDAVVTFRLRPSSEIPPRRREPAFPIGGAPERCASDLGALWWVGRQWAVTADGLEALDGRYFIAKDRLGETRRGSTGDIPTWPPQIGEKDWSDVDDFATAFLVALALHGLTGRKRFSHAAIVEAFERMRGHKASEPA